MNEKITLHFKTLPDGRLRVVIRHGMERAALTSGMPIEGVSREEKRRALDLTQNTLAHVVRQKLFPKDTLQFKQTGSICECLGYPE